MAYEFRFLRTVEFADTDMAGIAHFSNFFRYMEVTEAAFYRSLGLSVVMTSLHPKVGWPRVHAECDYFKPLRFEDQVEIHLLVEEKRTRSIRYLFRFYSKPAHGGPDLEVARGRVAVVCVTPGPDGGMTAIAIPEFFAKHIDPAPAALLQIHPPNAPA